MLENTSIFRLSYLRSFFVFIAFAGIFTTTLPSATLTQQKQRFVDLVKKHPVASVMVVVTVWLVYQMAGPPPPWWTFLRNKYYQWRGDRQFQPEYQREEALRRQQQEEADRRNPRPPVVSGPDPFELSRDWEEFEAEQKFEHGMLFSGDFPRWRAAKYGRGGPFIPTFSLNPMARTLRRDPVPAQANRADVPSRVVQLASDAGRERERFEAVLKRGAPQEQNNVGFSCLEGQGVERDESKAVELFEAAAAQRNKYAQYNLGFCYLFGRGVRKNLSKALTWFRTAASNGNLSSQVVMCHILGKGIFVSKDDTLANTYFEQIKKAVGSEAAARKKLDECDMYKRFMQPSSPKGSAGEQCSICQGARPPFQQGDWLSILPCQHFFCQDCIAKWFETCGSSKTCPNCRSVVQESQVIAGTVL